MYTSTPSTNTSTSRTYGNTIVTHTYLTLLAAVLDTPTNTGGIPTHSGRMALPTSRGTNKAELQRYRDLFNGCRSGDEATVRSLLTRSGMQVNLRGPRGATPLHIAARFGQLGMVNLLLAHGADATVRDDRGASPFDKAQANGLQSVSRRLALAVSGADKTRAAAATAAAPAAATKPATATLAAAAAARAHPVTPSAHAPANLGARTPSGAPSAARPTIDANSRRLLEAAYRCDMAQLKALLGDPDTGLVNRAGPRGATALHVAARYGHPEAVQLLLTHGADLHACDDKGKTALQKARQLKHHVSVARWQLCCGRTRTPQNFRARTRSPAPTHPLPPPHPRLRLHLAALSLACVHCVFAPGEF